MKKLAFKGSELSKRKDEDMETTHSLPEDVLCRVLSFLPTKNSYQKSLVSRSWRNLPHKVTSVNLDDSEFKDYDTFYNVLHLMLHERIEIDCARIISQFGFGILGYIDHPSVVLRSLSYKRVKELEFTSHIRFGSCPFRSIFTDLVKLTLVDIRLDFECNPRFPVLKVLKLNNVGFRDRVNVISFIRGCGLLEDLTASFLWIRNYRLSEDLEEPLPNLVTARLEESFLPLELISHATTLSARLDDMIHYHYIPQFWNLLHAEFTFASVEEHLWAWTYRILHSTPILKSLTIITESTKDRRGLNMEIIPQCVSSELLCLRMRSFKGCESGVQFVKYILRHGLVLKKCTVETINSRIGKMFRRAAKGSKNLQLQILS